jgi:tryptophanyl-tRNA synthetase
MTKKIIFNQEYYENVMDEFGYDPLKFGKINFSLGSLSEEDLQRRWLCHHDGDEFARNLSDGESVIVSTGFGLSGTPHAGTLSQILRSITLQKAGVPVHMVLGDLDAYNGKAKLLSKTLELAERYREFVLKLGFNPNAPSILRSQYDALDVLRTAYLIGHHMDDEMFSRAEEDLHEMYSRNGKVDADMSYRRKLSLNLMIADFINLHTEQGFNSVLVMLGIDEHQYVQFGRETVERMKLDKNVSGFDMVLAGMYSTLIKGFYDFPKMSKSFPQSGITVDMSPDDISKRILEGEGHYDKPENNVVYQMMAASNLFSGQLKENYEACLEGGNQWDKAKREYVDMLVDICDKWH